MDEFKKDVLKKYNKRRIFFLVRLSFVLLILIMLLLYFVTPISRVSSYSLTGNYYLQDEDILNILNIDRNSFLFKIDERKKEKDLSDYPLIKSGDIDVSFFSLKINLNEISPCLKEGNKDQYKIILKDGSIMDKSLLEDEIVGQRLKEIVSHLPFILTSLEKYSSNESISKMILSLAINMIAKYHFYPSYCDYESNNGPDGYFAFYFDAKEEIKDLLFSGNDGEILFLFKASCVQYYQDHLEDGISYLVQNFISRYEDILLSQDAKKAQKTTKNFLGEEKEYLSFKVELDGDKLVIKV